MCLDFFVWFSSFRVRISGAWNYTLSCMRESGFGRYFIFWVKVIEVFVFSIVIVIFIR